MLDPGMTSTSLRLARPTRCIFFGCVLIGLIGCGDDDDPMAMPDANVVPADTGTLRDTGSAPDQGTTSTDSGAPSDGNDSFATATAVPNMAIMGALDPAGDLDYYSFEGMAGDWWVISTTANADDDPMMIDTVVTLYDSNMQKVAENDDRLPRMNTDSELITRLPADGTYYVLVQEWSTWSPMGMSPEGGPTFTYELAVSPLNLEADLVTVDSEPGNTAMDAQTLRLNAGAQVDIGLVFGTRADMADTADVFAFTVAAGRTLVDAMILPGGPEGNGSTLVPTEMAITSGDGTETIARLNPTTVREADGTTSVSPNLPPGDYRLWVRSEGATGANDFFSIQMLLGADNPEESAATEMSNNIAATPDALTLEAIPDAMGMRGFVLARLPDGDIDHFSVNVANASDTVSVFCRSRTSGSGVVDLNVALLDATGMTEVATATESATEGASIESQAVSAAGTYLVRLSKGSHDSAATGDWVRCGVVLAPPAM